MWAEALVWRHGVMLTLENPSQVSLQVNALAARTADQSPLSLKPLPQHPLMCEMFLGCLSDNVLAVRVLGSHW